MFTERDLESALREPELEKFRTLYDYWKSKRNAEDRVLRENIDPIEIPSLLPNIFLVDVVRGGGARYRFRLAGTEICNREGNITGKFLDELGPEQSQGAMYKHYPDACDNRLYVREADLGWMGKPFTQYRVMLLPLHEPGPKVDMLIGLADYLTGLGAAGDELFGTSSPAAAVFGQSSCHPASRPRCEPPVRRGMGGPRQGRRRRAPQPRTATIWPVLFRSANWSPRRRALRFCDRGNAPWLWFRRRFGFAVRGSRRAVPQGPW